MKKILLTTVAVLPLLAVGAWPASSQEARQPGMSQGQSQGAAGAQEKRGSQGAAKSLTQGAQQKTQGAQERTEGRAQSAPSGNERAGQSGENNKSGEARSVGQSGSENRSVGQANERGKSAVTEGSQKGRQPSGKETRGAQNQNKGAHNPAQTSGQSNRNQPNGQNQRTGQQQQQQPSSTGQNQRQQPNTTGQNQRENQQNTQQNSTQQNQQGTNRGEGAEARGSVTLNEQQRTRIRETVLSGRDVPRVDRVDFSVNVGSEVPARVRVVEVPQTLIEIHPEWRGDQFFVSGEEIYIVDRSRRIVSVVPVSGRSSSVETRSSSTTASFDSPEEIRQVQEILIQKGFFHGRADGIMGRETRQALIEFQRKEGIEASGRIDERTMTSLGVSGKTEGQGGRQGVEPGRNQPGQNGQNRQGQPSTSGQGGNQNQPAANPAQPRNNPGQSNGQGGNQKSPGQTSGQGGNQNQPSANPAPQKSNPGQTSGQGGKQNQPSANPSGGPQNQPGNDKRRQ